MAENIEDTTHADPQRLRAVPGTGNQSRGVNPSAYNAWVSDLAEGAGAAVDESIGLASFDQLRMAGKKAQGNTLVAVQG